MRPLISLALISLCPVLFAGTSCERITPSPLLYVNASRQALDVQKKLNRLQANVVLIARAGTNLSKYSLRYSHVGFAVKNYPGMPGQWTILHLLNECGTSYSSLYAQGIMNFFMDNLYTQDYQLIEPDFATQSRLLQALSPTKIKQLHNKNYSIIAYPFSNKYQNSNQWVLEVLAASINPEKTPTQHAAQIYLHKTGYKPTVIRVDPLSKLGATLFNHIAFDDHPGSENRLNQFSAVTVISITNYLKKQGKLLAVIEHFQGV